MSAVMSDREYPFNPEIRCHIPEIPKNRYNQHITITAIYKVRPLSYIIELFLNKYWLNKNRQLK